MRYDYDSYLFYEVTPQADLAVRFKVNLREDVHAGVLDRSAQQAWQRFGYFAKTASLDDQGGYVLHDSDAPLAVLPETNRPLALGSEQTNGLFFAITYTDDAIYFNVFRGFCGPHGALAWIKCTLWRYLTNVHHTDIDTTGIILPDEPVSSEEVALPDVTTLPADKPIYEYHGSNPYLPLGDLGSFLSMPHMARTLYYPIAIGKSALMDYARENDGSPTSILCAAMYKALIRDLRGAHKADAITGKVACDYRKDVGCPETYHNLIRMLHVSYGSEASGWPMSKLCTVARGAMYLQAEPELSWKAHRELMAMREEIDELGSLREKSRHAKGCSPLSDTNDSYTVSYVGRTEWGGLADYIESIYTLGNGHLTLEVNSLPDSFDIAFHVLGRRRNHLDTFLQILNEEGISYTLGEPEDTRMPRITLPS